MLNRLWASLQPGSWGWWTTVAVAVAALVVIGLRPTVLRQSAPTVAVLLTAGVDQSAIDRVIDSLHPGRVVRTAAVDQWPVYPVVRDLQQLVARFPDTESALVLGWGLEEALLDSIPIPLTTRLASPPPGIVAVFPRTLPFGRVVHVTGRTLGVETGSSVILHDPLGPADSVVTDDDGTFALRYHPRAVGPMELRLTVTGDTSITERIAIQVVDPAPSRILILDAAPSFELSSLRRWLALGDASVAHRTAVSSGIYQQEFLNLPETGVRVITSTLLQRFDLVILDQRSLTVLNRGERRFLRRAVAEYGLGLLILADAGLEAASLGQLDQAFFMDAGWTTFPELEGRTVRPQWTDGEGPSTVPLPSDPAILEQRFGQAAVISDGTGGVLAQVTSRGAGKIALLTGVETVRWQRHGMNDAYAGFWNRLLSRVTRDPPGVDRWRMVSPAPALVDEQLLLEGRLDGASSHVAITTPSGMVDSVFLARSDETASSRGRYWPRETGWHRIAAFHGEGLFYVYDIDAWQAAAALRRSDATRRATLRSVPSTRPTTAGIDQPVPLGWVYGIFLLAASLLWLAEDRRRDFTS